MGKNQEFFFVFKFLIYFPHVIIHDGTNAFAGGEKIFNHEYFSCYIPFSKLFTVLVGKCKWPYIADRRNFFAKFRYQCGQHEIEDDDQGSKKADINPVLL